MVCHKPGLLARSGKLDIFERPLPLTQLMLSLSMDTVTVKHTYILMYYWLHIQFRNLLKEWEFHNKNNNYSDYALTSRHTDGGKMWFPSIHESAFFPLDSGTIDPFYQAWNNFICGRHPGERKWKREEEEEEEERRLKEEEDTFKWTEGAIHPRWMGPVRHCASHMRTQDTLSCPE